MRHCGAVDKDPSTTTPSLDSLRAVRQLRHYQGNFELWRTASYSISEVSRRATTAFVSHTKEKNDKTTFTPNQPATTGTDPYSPGDPSRISIGSSPISSSFPALAQIEAIKQELGHRLRALVAGHAVPGTEASREVQTTNGAILAMVDLQQKLTNLLHTEIAQETSRIVSWMDPRDRPSEEETLVLHIPREYISSPLSQLLAELKRPPIVEITDEPEELSADEQTPEICEEEPLTP